MRQRYGRILIQADIVNCDASNKYPPIIYALILCLRNLKSSLHQPLPHIRRIIPLRNLPQKLHILRSIRPDRILPIQRIIKIPIILISVVSISYSAYLPILIMLTQPLEVLHQLLLSLLQEPLNLRIILSIKPRRAHTTNQIIIPLF